MSELTSLSSWKSLEFHYKGMKDKKLSEMFLEDGDRASRFSVEFGDLLLDYSKNLITSETMDLLLSLANECGLRRSIDAMFNGVAINETENRSVLHIALRNRSNRPIMVEGRDVMPDVNDVLVRMCEFSYKVRAGEWLGYTGVPIRNIVNIGIGGSDLGPKMACEALKAFGQKDLNVYFVSNVDGFHMADTLAGLSPDETLFIIASKTFTTLETMTNANTARDWALAAFGSKLPSPSISWQFQPIPSWCQKFGIDTKNMFEFWNWVGGRYSMCSAIGLPIMLQIGRTSEHAGGFHAMDNARTERFSRTCCDHGLAGCLVQQLLQCSDVCDSPNRKPSVCGASAAGRYETAAGMCRQGRQEGQVASRS